jgi:hypothetical protein
MGQWYRLESVENADRHAQNRTTQNFIVSGRKEENTAQHADWGRERLPRSSRSGADQSTSACSWSQWVNAKRPGCMTPEGET